MTSSFVRRRLVLLVGAIGSLYWGCANRVILKPAYLSAVPPVSSRPDLTREPYFLWSFDAPGEPAEGGLALLGQVVAFPTKSRSVWFVDKNSGKKLGVYDLSGVPAGVLFDGRENFIVSEKSGNGQVFSCSLIDGEFGWRFDLNEAGEMPIFKKGADDPAGTLIATSRAGGVYALRADDGKLLWSVPLAPFSCPPVWNDSAVWLADFEGGLNAVFEGKIVKTIKLLQTVLALEPAGDKLVIGGGDSSVSAVSTSEGKTVWKTSTDGKVRSLAVNDSIAFFASSVGTIGACQLSNGQKLWERKLEVLVQAPLLAFTDVVIAGSADGRLFGLSAQSGEIFWERKLVGALVGRPVLEEKTLYLATLQGRVLAFSF